MEKFDRSRFESTEFLVESTEKPKIKAGGSSSSNTLNRYFEALSRDIALITTRTNLLASRASRLESIASSQGGSMLSAYQALSTRVDSASSYDQVFADLHSTFYYNTGSTTAQVNKLFGQATLPVLSRTNLITQTDSYGNIYISPEVQFYFTNTEQTDIGNLTFTDFEEDPEGIFMLKSEQAWLRNSEATNGFVRIRIPLQLRGLTANELEIWPLPAPVLDILNVWYKAPSDSESTWTALDLSYLPGWNGTKVVNAGPVRLHLPNVDISELAIAFDVSSVDVWGLKAIWLNHVEYDSSASLVVKDPYSRTVGDIIIRGKDPSDLSLLTVNTATNQATILLTTTSSLESPVITGVIMEV